MQSNSTPSFGETNHINLREKKRSEGHFYNIKICEIQTENRQET